MKTIRIGVFETNSSSTHSITINEDTNLFTSIIPDKNGTITLTGGQFGWDWIAYNDALTKANYCAVDACKSAERLEMLVSVIKNHTGAKEVILNIDVDWNKDNYSYIDHQSQGPSDIVFSSEEQLKKFIFDEKSYLYTGNDNTSEPINFFDHDQSTFTHYIKLENSDEKYLIKEEDINNNEKIINVVTRLFEDNVLNEYSDINQDERWNPNCKNKFYILDLNCPNSGVDTTNKTLTIIQQKYSFHKNGSFKSTTITDKKSIKFEICSI
jgi:hypothetical protein